jgi:O-methyltransferase involved in polyketide biosynthesis
MDFEAGSFWLEQLESAGFDRNRPAVISCTGVSLYLTRQAISTTLRQIAALAPGSTLAMTYILPLEFADPEERPGFMAALKGAQAAGTPFVSFFIADEMIAQAREAGFREARHVPAATLAQRYFAGRTDGLRPGKSEEILVATT